MLNSGKKINILPLMLSEENFLNESKNHTPPPPPPPPFQVKWSVPKANSIMGLIRRTMEYMDSNSFKLLYTALVRPHLEYASQVWCPHLAKHKDEIENVQRRATKQLPEMSNI